MTARLSTSSWSLHRALGPVYWDKPENTDRSPQTPYGPGNLSLLEVPAKLAEMGIHTMEICHFHLPTLDAAYLDELRAALDEVGVQLFSLLIDDGDITHPEYSFRDIRWVVSWLEIAGQLGAERARVIAGKTTGNGALGRSKVGLDQLEGIADANNVRLMTENWFDLLATPADVSEVLDSLDGRVGLCFDFGNWRGPTKYDNLAQIAKYAESCHAKCSFEAPLKPDRADYERCLQITKDAGFDGPYTLIYDGPDDDEWAGIVAEMEIVTPYLK